MERQITKKPAVEEISPIKDDGEGRLPIKHDGGRSPIKQDGEGRLPIKQDGEEDRRYNRMEKEDCQ
jgi:hypothetical protein